MSLLFIHTWVRDIRKGVTPWTDDIGRCEEDPRWTCAWALREIYDDLEEVIPPFMTHYSDNVIHNRNRSDGRYNKWQYTEIESVNSRIRIYK